MVEVVSVPARNRSREHIARLVSLNPRSDVLCYSEIQRRHSDDGLVAWQKILRCNTVCLIQSLTYILHFNQEGVNVVPGVVVVQVLLVPLYLLTDEIYEGVEVAEKFVVRPWQVLHQSWE